MRNRDRVGEPAASSEDELYGWGDSVENQLDRSAHPKSAGANGHDTPCFARRWRGPVTVNQDKCHVRPGAMSRQTVGSLRRG